MTTMTTVSAQAFRDGMARLGAAVNIVTTHGPAGMYGLTASSVCSVTDAPPTLLVCMKRASGLRDFFVTNGSLCVNVLAADHQNLSGIFAGMTDLNMEGRFTTGEWRTMVSGAPALSGAIACFDTAIVRTIEVGTHTIFLCEVLDVELGETPIGLVYFQRKYHHLRDSADPDLKLPVLANGKSSAVA
ncbi:flavin reductase [Mesorhizobium sp. CAU 1732]|uniref:flavin reductase n=1 Tax=Mesorhizobium sp. CAU 1732 TaxID=3140358 RepID=UPI00325FE4AB